VNYSVCPRKELDQLFTKNKDRVGATKRCGGLYHNDEKAVTKLLTYPVAALDETR